MSDPTNGDDRSHQEKVHQAFDALQEHLKGRVSAEESRVLDSVRDAAARRSPEEFRQGLAIVRERHGWLSEEMARHPQFAALVDELSLWGF